MKRLILALLASLACATAAQAQNWSEILADPSLYVNFPHVQFKAGPSKPIVKVCFQAENGTLYGGKAEICDTRYGDGTCAGTKLVDLVSPLQRIDEICTLRDSHGACEASATVLVPIPLSYDIPVFRKGPRGVSDWNPVFTKTFAIPSCEIGGHGGGTGGDN